MLNRPQKTPDSIQVEPSVWSTTKKLARWTLKNYPTAHCRFGVSRPLCMSTFGLSWIKNCVTSLILNGSKSLPLLCKFHVLIPCQKSYYSSKKRTGVVFMQLFAMYFFLNASHSARPDVQPSQPRCMHQPPPQFYSTNQTHSSLDIKTFHCFRRKCIQRQGIGPWWPSVPETDWLAGWGELIDLMTDPSEPQPPFCSLRRYLWRSLTRGVDTWSNRPLNCQTQGIISSGCPSLGRCRLDDGHVVLMPGETSGDVGGRWVESSPRGVCEKGLLLTISQQISRQLSYEREEDWKSARTTKSTLHNQTILRLISKSLSFTMSVYIFKVIF